MRPVLWTGQRQGDHLQPLQSSSPLPKLPQEGAPVLGQREEQQQPLTAQQQLHRVTPPELNIRVKIQMMTKVKREETK